MRFLTAVPLLLLLVSCGPDEENLTEEASLTGRWELTEARRDNVKTGLLDGLYFEFQPDGTFLTNLLTGESQTGTYQLDDNEIITEGVEVPMTYEVQELSENNLLLRAKFQGYLFDFNMRRSGNTEEVENTELQ